ASWHLEELMERFTGKNVVVTGGAQGIGKAISERFTAEAARVLVAAENAEGGSATAKELGGLSIGCDVTKADQVQAMIDHGLAEMGAIDILVNNAGPITMKS